MASSVATPLERRFGRIAGLTEMTSVSSLGSTSITLQFDLDRDITGAARDVQAAINAAGAELPPNLPTRPNYRKVNPADSPILILSLTSKTLPLAQVFDAANSVLAQKISQIEGVGQVFVGGGQQPAVRVQVDQEVLAGRGLSLEDVRAALASSTANQPKGTLTGAARRLQHRRDRSAAGRRRLPPADRLVPERRHRPARRRGQGVRRRREQPAGGLDRRPALRAHDHPPPAGRQHPRHHRRGQGGAAVPAHLDLAGHRPRRSPSTAPRPSAPRSATWSGR